MKNMIANITFMIPTTGGYKEKETPWYTCPRIGETVYIDEGEWKVFNIAHAIDLQIIRVWLHHKNYS